jgi:hypothetical protein
LSATQSYLISENLFKLDFTVDPKTPPINPSTAVKVKSITSINLVRLSTDLILSGTFEKSNHRNDISSRYILVGAEVKNLPNGGTSIMNMNTGSMKVFPGRS